MSKLTAGLSKTLAGLACVAGVLLAAGARLDRSSQARPVVSTRGVLLMVATYNIHTGIGMDKKLDLARIARVIKETRADIVGLQEVDRGVKRTGGIDEIAELARLTGMDYAFAHNLDYQGGQYGV
ncbi:MAG: metal-dependent hydrolase, partial [Acidobacteria bacterium]|nr:metal-dependent hydrolase [Acidobacteriota bacterium]